MSTILLILEPGTRIQRFDHVHPLRACHLNLWGRTFPGAKWRCGEFVLKNTLFWIYTP